MLSKRNYYKPTVLCTCTHKVVILVPSVKMENHALYGLWCVCVPSHGIFLSVCSGCTKQASGCKCMRVANEIWCASVNTS